MLSTMSMLATRPMPSRSSGTKARETPIFWIWVGVFPTSSSPALSTGTWSPAISELGWGG